jgi:hypothetical protein
MQKNRKQGVVFGILMSFFMALGMEIYNAAFSLGVQTQTGGLSNMTWDVLKVALSEVWYMAVIVYLFSALWGNRIGAAFAAKHCDPEKDNPYYCRLLRQAGTVAVMCPSMSLAASLLFNVLRSGMPVTQLPMIWIGTLIKNFPMAFFWNMFGAAPLTHLVFGWIFPDKEKRMSQNKEKPLLSSEEREVQHV